MRRSAFLLLIPSALFLPAWLPGEPQPGTPTSGPLSPREEQATFKLQEGFKVELVAAEPEVIDPVAMTFDEKGRLFVVEMRGYPNGGIGEGDPNLPGRVKLLEDSNGDGYYEKATVFVDNLRFPTGVCAWKGGIYVADAPNLLWCQDRDGDGTAEHREIVYTGFGFKNIQQLLNGLQFHLDNHIHGCNGSNDSVVSSPSIKGMSVALRGRHFRFKPGDLTSFEPTSGGGQYGLSSDDSGNWFTCTNSQHLRHIVLPDHYLKRNPQLTIPTAVHDIPDGGLEHTPAARVFRLSPFERWRVERTARRVRDPSYQQRLPATELVPGGYITSATGLAVYRGGAFPPDCEGNVFVADPANNLIHRDVLLPVGATFIAKRHETERDCEFMASTDNWFRPVFLSVGPDGALYVCDFYREIIETPLSLPEDIQKQYNLNSRERGRIWRIVHSQREAQPATSAKLSDADNEALVLELASPNAWRRQTAQRLLIERQARDAAGSLATMAHVHQDRRARMHALWTLKGLDALEARSVQLGLRDRAWQVREQALRLAEPWLDRDPAIRQAALALTNDPTPRVRFQLAFSIGQMKPADDASSALARIAQKDGVSPWVQAAVLSSAVPHAPGMMREFERSGPPVPELMARLVALLAAGGNEDEVERILRGICGGENVPTLAQCQILDGLGQGLARTEHPLARRAGQDTATGRALRGFLVRACKSLADGDGSAAERVSRVRLLRHGPYELVGSTLAGLLSPQTPIELQLAAIQTLSAIPEPASASAVLAAWPSLGPAARREAQEMLFARKERLPFLVEALEKGTVQPGQLDPVRREQLRKTVGAERVARLLAEQSPEDRRKVLAEWRSVLNKMGDAAAGKQAFRKHCTGCHRLENEGHEVGPDLLSALKTKTRETLYQDILDPSREVDGRYLNYVVRTSDGRTVTGLIASETATSLVLRRADRAEDVLLRDELEEIRSTAKSLMPEGLERQLTQNELADVIAYLLEVASRK